MPYLTKSRLTIRHFETGEFIDDLEVDAVVEGQRDEHKCLLQPGGVNFRTEKGKTFFLPFTKFCFVFNRRPEPKAKRRAA